MIQDLLVYFCDFAFLYDFTDILDLVQIEVDEGGVDVVVECKS